MSGPIDVPPEGESFPRPRRAAPPPIKAAVMSIINGGKVDDAFSGPALDAEARKLPHPNDPMAVARAWVSAQYLDRRTGALVLRHWRGDWWNWATSHWVELEKGAIRHDAYAFTEHAVWIEQTDAGPVAHGWLPTRFKIANLLEALAAITYLLEEVDQPSWTEEIGIDGLIVACHNGLLQLQTRRLLPHDPRFFNLTAVPFDYQPDAAVHRWTRFMDELWPDDDASVTALQEFMGYVVSGRLDLHKILLIVGPTRGGKGTIARILGKMIGTANVAGPTLSSLSYDFGLAPLLGKSLAVISDARLDTHRDASVVVERLLSISGEDTLTVNRKYRDQWTGKLPTRFLIISNELPRLGDASGTIANRFVVLLLQRSWLGREDHGLEDALSSELSGILNWALAGLDRLAEQDHFTRPASTDEAIIALQDLASPVAAFVRDSCEAGPLQSVPVADLYTAWKTWAEDNGQRRSTAQTFGRDLRAVIPGLRVERPRDHDDRVRVYRGVGLRDQAGPSPSTAHKGPDRGPSRTTPSETADQTDGPEAGPETPLSTNWESGPRWSAVQPNVGRTQTETWPDPDDSSPAIVCADHTAHQAQHRRVGDGWVCDACSPEPGPEVAT